MSRAVMLITHTGRPNVVTFAREIVHRLLAAGFEVRALPDEADDVGVAGVRPVSLDDRAASESEIVLALGGDGTFLRAAEVSRPTGVPLLGVNLGLVGFLAEAEPHALESTVEQLLSCSYHVEERLTLDVTVRIAGQETGHLWALNEASIERARRDRILEVVLEVDDHPVTSFGCDGVLCATPTGSTAYAFSAGGPVIWPEVDALLVTPNSAHAVFARPLVIGPQSVIAVDIAESGHDGVVVCDGRRAIPVSAGGRVEVRRGSQPVRVARLHRKPFSDRLVAKFALPVQGFRALGRCRNEF